MAYVAFIMVVIKMLFDLLIYFINKANQLESEKQTSEGVTCVYYYEKDEKGQCSNVAFKRNMNSGRCPREDCHGFNTGKSEISNEMIFTNSPWLLIIKKVIDLFPEFAAALLALNEIIAK